MMDSPLAWSSQAFLWLGASLAGKMVFSMSVGTMELKMVAVLEIEKGIRLQEIWRILEPSKGGLFLEYSEEMSSDFRKIETDEMMELAW